MRGHVAGTSCSDQVPSTSEMKAIVRWTNFAAEIQFISQESHSFSISVEYLRHTVWHLLATVNLTTIITLSYLRQERTIIGSHK